MPEDPEFAFQRSIGVFLSIAEKGFRGFDLTARLVWEERFGACKKPDGVRQDAIDSILTRAVDQRAPVRDVAIAVKDRLIAEARLEPGESELIEALIDRPFSEPADRNLEPGLRRLCGALLNSPQHLLAGLASRGGDVPALAPSSADACRALSALPSPTYRVDCDGATLAVRRRAN